MPITNWRSLLGAVRDSGASAPLDQLLRAARLRLQDQLPGNAPDSVRIRLPAEIERQMLSRRSGRAFLAVSPQQKHELQTWLRNEMRAYGRGAVLVTASSELRPLLSGLVRAEFPMVNVLSEEELVTR